ncbi:uncharacterized protein LOC126840714 [Adelges cooleyi]|uniref:uncharacterized protein LOC126840714 n=1 Tax=Adelges cooleyi TaxID=133065 RepID=UPI00217F7A6C|nr:uncharacterized protein LOC126840714 [Adelges cooleyi]
MNSKRPQLAPNRYMFMVITVVMVLLTVNSGAAKRGCAMFGHSCYGGFGKRSFQQPAARDWPVTNDEASQIDLALNKYFQVKSSSPHFTPYWQKWVEVYNQHNKLNQPSEDNIM